ncbi:Transmembrane emp24 domain-containing protein 4 [Phytophthora nicotianae]|uniref:Transmembrane emp24 domain-containing protein 4 n=1 Tax=Phytophthora nicotianae TaxID=4792 RepID=A0A0W8CVH0_PHYNI|nr:Transmembrane emp24 domain-containing protein 4 [Phytophthora nicotianae]
MQGHRCFLVDVPKETTFRAEYESPDTTDVMKTIVAFYAPDPSNGEDEKTLVKKEPTSVLTVYVAEKGAISFSAQQNGPHWVCVSLDSSNYALPDDASMRFALKLSMGTSHEEYQNLAKKNQMDDLHLEIMKLRDRVSAIQRNQDYAKIAILLATGFYQAKHLQTYFHKKKLV